MPSRDDHPTTTANSMVPGGLQNDPDEGHKNNGFDGRGDGQPSEDDDSDRQYLQPGFDTPGDGDDKGQRWAGLKPIGFDQGGDGEEVPAADADES